MRSNHQPEVIDVSKLSAELTPAHMRTARAVTPENGGPSLLFGLTWLDPGQSSGHFTLLNQEDVNGQGAVYGESDEIFYVISGRLRVESAEQIAEAPTGSILHLPPGGPYRLTNVGAETMKAVYALVPFTMIDLANTNATRRDEA